MSTLVLLRRRYPLTIVGCNTVTRSPIGRTPARSKPCVLPLRSSGPCLGSSPRRPCSLSSSRLLSRFELCLFPLCTYCCTTPTSTSTSARRLPRPSRRFLLFVACHDERGSVQQICVLVSSNFVWISGVRCALAMCLLVPTALCTEKKLLKVGQGRREFLNVPRVCRTLSLGVPARARRRTPPLARCRRSRAAAASFSRLLAPPG
ncbi:hypothetical protein OH76DRAFT_176020 [Lentinus brumalis]|uniref:Uncharacterized protein n=1 Tax=Lentinus brumalis TaxID=2498619 RepID=A0A371CNI8_9APHY|nr:hypothetical protein OH76DRAFT_176020 [Polyporus brumalis]